MRLWAPQAERVRLRTASGEAELISRDGQWWELPADTEREQLKLAAGTDYVFLLDDSDDELPDPRSRWQPAGVHGPSRSYDDESFVWSDSEWTGRVLPGAILYELHIGTFTPGATFDSAIEKLDHLVDLGITHVELLPVNAFNGVWNWGYDGVDWYAVHDAYGGPDGLKRFVDAAHRRGLAVVLDVVYNHLGPSGNYLPKFGPYLKSGRNTWGDLVNLEVEAVRRFIIDNALMWLRDFHIDGLRLDAVHALVDSSTPHLLTQLATEVDALSAAIRRPLSLIAESDLNDPVMITSRESGGHGLTAQWDDDVHHSLHALLTGERQGYYDDFGSFEGLRKVLTSAFFHDGTYSTFRRRRHGAPVNRVTTPGYRFVVCLQNHDQIGNRAVGDRLPEITSSGRLKIGAVLLLTSPFTPMLWMGEEWRAATRWPFFTSHPEPELAEATGAGRLAEFADHGWDTSQMINPQDPAAYREAILDWSEPSRGEHREMLELYRRLIALRHETADLSDPRLDLVSVDLDEARSCIVVHRGRIRVLVNLDDAAHDFDVAAEEVLLATGECSQQAGVITVGRESAAIVQL
ncbi:malto-oligosyltrehalose trehalohydrolase [Jatrophihabitans sp. GAS493]|uniref:malto-oligosyltrehalose trehalohydrolase n=1 Tax=Jatrophihabitans sp. GAS493 TaxID=1907575 RepID=UPI000BB92751